MKDRARVREGSVSLMSHRVNQAVLCSSLILPATPTMKNRSRVREGSFSLNVSPRVHIVDVIKVQVVLDLSLIHI